MSKETSADVASIAAELLSLELPDLLEIAALGGDRADELLAMIKSVAASDLGQREPDAKLWTDGKGNIFTGEHGTTPLGGALTAITVERLRQIESEGWTPEHDDAHDEGELAEAAACYAVGHRVEDMWPWDDEWWKPDDTRRNLVKAGALIVAEIERLDRAAAARADGQ